MYLLKKKQVVKVLYITFYYREEQKTPRHPSAGSETPTQNTGRSGTLQVTGPRISEETIRRRLAAYEFTFTQESDDDKYVFLKLMYKDNPECQLFHKKESTCVNQLQPFLLPYSYAVNSCTIYNTIITKSMLDYCKTEELIGNFCNSLTYFVHTYEQNRSW